PLKPWAGHPGRNWTIEFKSTDQGRDAMQAAAIGGAWFTEQYPREIFEEVFRGLREFAFPGCLWSEFTPVDPRYSAEVEQQYNLWIAGDESVAHMGFHHLSTQEAVEAGHAKRTWLVGFEA